MKKILFNENWTFQKGSGNEMFAALMGGGSVPETVNLPHDSVIGDELVNEGLGAVGHYKGSNVNYVKKFQVPQDWANKAVQIEFEGVYQNAMIYVNNSYAGTAHYGYGEHYFDIRRFLNPGAENEIKVVVKNGTNPAGRWYCGGGIYRDVQLHVSSLLHIVPTGTRAAAETVEADQATVRVVTPLVHEGVDVVTAFVCNEILDAQGQVVASETLPITFFDHEEKELRQRLVVENHKLWDAEHPYLYTIRTSVTAEGKLLDSYESTFGIRYMQLDAKKGLRINGKVVKLKGGCIHHDNGVVGTATFGDSEERRVRIMKEMGYNAIRMAHHPVSKAMLRACDKLGMYIMDEFSDVWCSAKAEFDYGINMAQYFQHDVTQMVLKDYNHPSVILYSIGNEIPENGNKFDVAFGRKIVDIIRSLDDTRYILNSINVMLAVMQHMGEIMAAMGAAGGDAPSGEINSMMASLGDVMGQVNCHPISSKFIEECCGQVDISGYNYAEDRYAQDLVNYPNRILVGSETFPAKLAKNWALVEQFPHVLGDFVWTSWDYLGESAIGKNAYEGEGNSMMSMCKWPERIAMCGTIDLLGVPQPIAYWRQIVWGGRKEPYINVNPPSAFGKKVQLGAWGWSDGQSTWTWKGDEGKPVDVDVYADADEVELIVNGISLGRKPVGEEYAFVAKFQTVYQPGQIKAIAYKGGEAYEHTLCTAGQAGMTVSVENPQIQRLTGAAYVNVTLEDGNGVVDPCAVAAVTVEVEGGVLQGLGSADPVSHEKFTGNVFKTYRGRLQAVIRGMEPGDVTVKISAPGYKPQTVHITVK